nr:hypothetical protein [Nostoc sp. EkiNYC01]
MRKRSQFWVFLFGHLGAIAVAGMGELGSARQYVTLIIWHNRY